MLRRFRKPFLIVVLALAVVAAVGLFITPPVGVVRQIAVRAAAPLLTGSTPEDAAVTRLAKRLAGAYVQMAIAEHLADTVVKDGRSDEQILYDMMRIVRAKTLNHLEFSHAARTWPMLLSGAGYCDQLNAAVCMLAATYFPKSEIYALVEPGGQLSPHTIGRVWSEQRNDWLYFDAFWDEPTLFRRGADGKPRFETLQPPQTIPGRGVRLVNEYSYEGRPLTSFQRTFGQFLASRLVSGGVASAALSENVVNADTDDGSPIVGDVTLPEGVRLVKPLNDAGVAWDPRSSRDRKAADAAYDEISRRFVAARLDHLFGRKPPTQEYLRIATTRIPHGDARTIYIRQLAKSLANASADVKR